MKDVLSGIVAMLERGEPAQRVAAAQVLAYLKPKQPEIVEALGRAAMEGDSFLRPYAVEALGAIANQQAMSLLIPLLHSDGPLRSRIVRTFAKLGTGVEHLLVREFQRVDPDTQGVILEVLATTRGAEAMKTLLGALKEQGSELAQRAAQHLIAEVDHLAPDAREQRTRLRTMFLSTLSKLPKTAPDSLRVHLLELLRRVADPSCRAVFFQYGRPNHAPVVRGAALRGMAGLGATPAQVDKLLEHLREDDFVNVVGPTLEVLGELQVTSKMSRILDKLLDSPRPEVRLFALRGMGRLRTLTAAKRLQPFLDSDDPRVQTLTSEGLGHNPAAREGLLKRILAARDLGEANRPVEALTMLARELTPLQVKKITARFLKLVEADDPVREPLQRVLAACKPTVVAPLLREEAKKLRTKRRFADALRLLQVISTAGRGEMDAEARYEMAVTTLLMRGRDRQAPEGDPVIGHLSHLIRSGYKLLGRLKRERMLDHEDLLYIGQRFVERLNEERRFGTEILSWLIEKVPEAKAAIQAMQKLKIEGLA
jgi:HEAT repeat protein